MEVIFWALVFFYSLVGVIYWPIKLMVRDKPEYILAVIVGLTFIFLSAFSGVQIVRCLG